MTAYCAKQDNDGWLCILKRGHGGAHLSLDNSRLWKRTPGFPITWPNEPELTREQTDEMKLITDPMLTQGEIKGSMPPGFLSPKTQLPGYTGIPCQACGGLNTVRIGKCLRCAPPPLGCGQDGECG